MVEEKFASIKDQPAGSELLATGRRLAEDVKVGRTAFFDHFGVSSEREYRERGREVGRLFTAFNIGMKDWPSTKEALMRIERTCLDRDIRPPDHWQFIPERRMGLPKEQRRAAMQETGPVLWDEDDWLDWGHCTPCMQPQAGDNMIGGPASIENAIDALRAGSTYVGCLSQMTWKWPYFDDDIAQLSSMITACGILSAKASEGVVLDTYIEDGYPAVFADYGSLVGWALIERRIADLCGVPLSVAWGGLTSHPINKSVVTIALDMLDPDNIPPTFVQGDTISYTTDIERNSAICSEDTLFMLAVQYRYKTGSSALPVPLTENLRVPTADEIAQVQIMAREIERRVPEISDHLRWDVLEDRATTLAARGRAYFDRVMNGLSDGGVDVNDVLQLVVGLRRLGGDEIERRYGFSVTAEDVYPTELFVKAADAVLKDQPHDLSRRVVVLGSTDVHVAAKSAIGESLRHCGAQVVDCGVNCDPEDLIEAARRDDAHAIVISTHNGVARSYGLQLAKLSHDHGLYIEMYMGGVLNEDSPESDTPVDASRELNALGISTPGGIDALLEALVLGANRSPLSVEKEEL
jgi:methylmalonyl-CoA mutase cobalamin-binding subunit